MKHQKFSYNTLEDVRKRAREVDAWIPLSDDLSVLTQKYEVAGRSLHSRIAFQPMEGSDSLPDGSPGEMTIRRYQRFAHGGPALIWFEAVAIVPEARASARQLHLTKDNLDAFKQIIETIKRDCYAANGFEPVVIMQAAHSGRYSRPEGQPAPIIACNNPIYEKDAPIDTSRIITDQQIQRLEGIYGQSAKLAQQAGFDGVDIKACHRYLISELLGAHLREGNYGGSFQNRIRLLLNAVSSAQAETTGDFIVTSRLNVHDGLEHPYGFGAAPNAGVTPDLSEPIQLVDILHNQMGMQLINVTIGNPYVNPHYNRPYDNGNYVPDEHPLTGVSRIVSCASQIQGEFPALCVMSSGLSYLRQFSFNLGAGMLEGGHAGLAGYGREAFAYPDFPRDLHAGNGIDSRHVCITCGQCAARLRAGLNSGCVLTDRESYKPV